MRLKPLSHLSSHASNVANVLPRRNIFPTGTIPVPANRRFGLAKRAWKKEILTMISAVTSKGQTLVPKALRKRFNIKSGATLDWQEDGQSLRVIQLEPRKA